MGLIYILGVVQVLIALAFANVEKTIFLGPPAVIIPTEHPNLEDLHLSILGPGSSSLRTSVKAVFPTEEAPRGKDAWYLLEELTEGQRYELRVCWAATQPTAFSLDTHTLDVVFGTPHLISSLADFSETKQNPSASPRPSLASAKSSHKVSSGLSSVLFVRLFAAADYYTTNATLMHEVPLVQIDLIFDPYLLNVFPASLLSTALYICILAIGSYLLSGYVYNGLRHIARPPAATSPATANAKKTT
ncbi:MAG: hypothetical protein M1817_004714 [Caeruleum heppii]|nr:MAG: hypothetical protein M1817_004714 [Caeruleum heppii]